MPASRRRCRRMRGGTARAFSSSRPTYSERGPLDNLCHTLVGAALGEAGLKRRTRFGNATLMIAANLPDLDVLVFFTDTAAISFRRGWTHGLLAQALLPVALAVVVWLAGKW